MKPTSKEVINELCKILDATPKEKVKELSENVIDIRHRFHADDLEPYMNEKGYNELQAYTHLLETGIEYDFKIIDLEVRKVEHVIYGREYKFKAIIEKL